MAPPVSHPTPARALRGLIIAFGISSIGFASMAPFIVIWGHRDAGLGGSAAGLLFVAQAIGELSGGLTGGVIADRVGARQVLLISTAGMALAYGLLAAVGSPGLAIALIFVGGLFEAAYHPTAFALIGDLTTEDRRSHAYSVVRAAGNVGTIVGPLAGAAVVAGVSLADVFLIAGALLAASGVVVFVTLPRSDLRVDLGEEAEELQAAVPGIRAIGQDRRLRWLIGGGALLTITLAWWEADGLAILRSQRPFGTGTFSIMIALGAALIVVFQVPVTRLTRRVPIGRLLAIGATVQAIGLALLALAAHGLVLVGAGVVLIAAGDMLYSPNLNTLVSTLAPRGREVTYQAALSTTADIGNAIGPASGLALSGGAGAQLMWLLALPLGLLAGAGTSAAARGRRRTSD